MNPIVVDEPQLLNALTCAETIIATLQEPFVVLHKNMPVKSASHTCSPNVAGSSSNRTTLRFHQ